MWYWNYFEIHIKIEKITKYKKLFASKFTVNLQSKLTKVTIERKVKRYMQWEISYVHITSTSTIYQGIHSARRLDVQLSPVYLWAPCGANLQTFLFDEFIVEDWIVTTLLDASVEAKWHIWIKSWHFLISETPPKWCISCSAQLLHNRVHFIYL